MKSDAYMVSVCRSVGVPELFLEDGVQELRLAEWQGRILRTAAIDFVRKVGQRSRAGVAREYGYIDGTENVSRDFTDTSDRVVDLERAWTCLTAKQQRALAKNVCGIVGTGSDYMTCTHARKKLKAAC